MTSGSSSASHASAKPRARPRSALIKRLALIPLAMAGAILVAELGLRVYLGELFSWSNLRRPFAHRSMSGGATGGYDRELGWTWPPGEYDFRGGGVTGPWRLTVTADGLRDNGAPRPAGRPVLAVGDSFTMGNEVNDDETYAAYLEQLLNRPVLNAGVSSYGLDQAVLRAEQLLPQRDPELVVMAYVEDDIMRCELSYHTTWKPYFDVEGGELVLRNSPVPPGITENSVWRPTPPPSSGWVGYSHLARVFGEKFNPQWWVFGMGRQHDRGVEVAGLLLLRLQQRVREHGAKLLVVRLYPARNEVTAAPELERARAAGVEVLDLGPEIFAAAGKAKRGEVLLASGHLSPAMNRWAAERMAERVRVMLEDR